MGYLLLWSILERYAALRYHLAGESAGKVDYIAMEIAFIEGVREQVREPREVCIVQITRIPINAAD